jgi:hypothetical protein
MLGLVTLRLEVEVVLERMVTALANTRQDNGHVELSPTLLVDAERRLLDDCSLSVFPSSPGACLSGALTVLVLLEGRVEVVDGLLEDVGHDLVALVVQQPDLYAP